MNINGVIDTLKKQYPGKKIILNSKENLTEILCEVDPTLLHPSSSMAVSVIDFVQPHYHNETTEIYEVVKGQLTLLVDGKPQILSVGQSTTIYPGQIHSASGDETWIKVSSTPGWTKKDHILVEEKSL